jgi:hypothetical protein
VGQQGHDSRDSDATALVADPVGPTPVEAAASPEVAASPDDVVSPEGAASPEPEADAPDGHEPGGHARVAGAFLAAAAAEARLATDTPAAADGARPVTAAMMELAQAYVASHGQGAPLDVAARLGKLESPAWLLAVAVARPRSAMLDDDALRLANASGAPGHALPHCVGYVGLAAALLGGRPAAEAIESVTGQRPRTYHPTALTLCGEPHLDALSTAIWALQQPAPLHQVVESLATLATPGVAAAAAGLLGLRDGVRAVPARWYAALPEAEACVDLAGELVRCRHRAYLQSSPPRRPRPLPGPGAGRIASATSGAGETWGWSGAAER